MTVLRIRAHQRFAVRREATILRAGRTVGRGLLVELSLGGCRLGGVTGAALEEGEALTIAPDGAAPFEAQVRWTVNGTLGFRLLSPFRHADLESLLRHCRAGLEISPSFAYGT